MTDQVMQLMLTQAWQIAIVVIIVAGVVRFVAKNRPHVAHAMWILVLIKCVTPPIWGHSFGIFSQIQMLAESDVESLAVAEPASIPHSLSIKESHPAPFISENDETAITTLQLASDLSENPRSVSEGVTNLVDESAIEVSAPSKILRLSMGEIVTGRTFWQRRLLIGAMAGAILTLLITLVRCLRCLRLIQRHRTAEFDDVLNERLQQLAATLRIRRVPRIVVTDVLFGPAVLGFLRHTIVLPRCLLKAESGQQKADQIDAPGLRPTAFDCPLSFLDLILAHELLHIRRGDLRTGALQVVAQSLWWFHPAVWLSNRWLSREAERCCDEQVIAELGCSPAQYARSLLSVIESKHQLQPIPVFPGMKPVEITTQRMERIMSLRNGLKKQTPLWCWLAVAALAIVVLPGAVATPQSDDKIVATVAEEMSEPQKAQLVADSPAEVFAKTYEIGDLLESLAKSQDLSAEQASKSMVQIFETLISPVFELPHHKPVATNTKRPALPTEQRPAIVLVAEARSIKVLSSLRIEAKQLIVVQSEGGHENLQEQIDRLRKFGFTQFQVTARYITGPAEQIASLMSSLKLDKPFETLLLKKQTISATVNTKPELTTYEIGLAGIVSREQAQEIEELARAKADQFTVQCLQVTAFNGQRATIQGGETTPYIVGFEENDEPMIRTIVDGLTLQVTPTVVDSGLYRLQSMARIEGATQVQTVSVGKHMTETPRKFQMPTITTKQIQTTVELWDDQALLQTGLVTTVKGTSQAVLVILEARCPIPKVDFSTSKGVIPEERVNVITGGVNVLVEGLDVDINGQEISPGVIDFSADRVVIWTQTGEGDALESGNQAAMSADVDYVIDEPSGVGIAIAVPANIDALKEVKQSADPTVKLAWETRDSVQLRLLSADQHTPWQIMNGLEGLRRDMLLKNGHTTVNAIEWIQAGPVYQGEPWFEKTEHGGRAHPFSKPYWFEGHVNQFLSKLAACRLPLDATFGTPDGPITIQDMINHAKMVVNDKEEVSWTLLALCRYLPPDAKWTNAKGEEWSIERLVEVEAGKTVGGPTSPDGGTDGLYALAVARNAYLNTGKPLEGVWLKADEKIKKYIDVARSQQNPDGTLSSDFFRSSKRKENFNKRSASTGHLLQFLMHAISDEQLKDDWIRRAVEATANDIQSNRKVYVSDDPLFTTTEALTAYLERATGSSPGIVGEAAKPSEEFVLVTYNVADLVVPFGSTVVNPDLSPIVELIKTVIEPDSWRHERSPNKITSIQDTLSLVIRQTTKNHEQIAKLLSQLRKDQTQIQISCQLLRITTDEQLHGLKERCNLLSVPGQDELSTSKTRRHWALLDAVRSEQLGQFLAEQKAERLSAPNICMISDQDASVEVGSHDDGAFRGFRLNARPHLVHGSSVIRLSHSVTIGKAPKETGSTPVESLMSSGQTLLLLVEIPQESALSKVSPESSMQRFVILLTAETVEEEEMIAPPPPGNSTPDDSLRSSGGR